MGLTSPAFIRLAIAAAAGSLAVLVWAWPRLAGPRLSRFLPVAVLARLTALAVTQILVVGAFLVWLNAYFAFYGTWAQLLGTPSRPAPAPAVTTAPRPGPAQLLIHRSAPGPAPWGSGIPLAAPRGRILAPGLDRKPAVDGELLQISFRGQRTGVPSGPGFVYLPPEYFQPAYARARFPVVLALSGYPGEAVNVVRQLGLPSLAAHLLALGQLRPAVYVILNVSPLLPVDSECTDFPGGPQVLSFFAQDVPHAVEQAFRVSSSPRGWGVLGYSTGGYCAAKLAMLYPSRFSAAVSLAGYYDAEWGHGLPHQWGDSGAYQNENNLDWRLRHLPAPPVSVLVTSSHVGELSLPGTLSFLHRARPPMHVYALLVPQGGHNFRTWQRELPQSLKWLSQRLRLPGQQYPEEERGQRADTGEGAEHRQPGGAAGAGVQGGGDA
jgi:enterochelin esterase-like enzyme